MSRDPIVNAVIDQFEARSDEGMRHYGMSMAANPKTPLQWLQDAQEELMDAILYLEALRGSMPLQPIPAAPQCYVCGGTGQIKVEYTTGGYSPDRWVEIRTRWKTCEECGGSGEVPQ